MVGSAEESASVLNKLIGGTTTMTEIMCKAGTPDSTILAVQPGVIAGLFGLVANALALLPLSRKFIITAPVI
jgi:hypothetical protein